MSDLRRRAAPFVLVAGLALAGGLLLRSAPKENDIAFAFRGDRSEVVGFSCDIREENAASSDVDESVRFAFATPPPPVLHRQVTVAPGKYLFSTRVELRDKSPISKDFSVQLAGGEKRLEVPVEIP